MKDNESSKFKRWLNGESGIPDHMKWEDDCAPQSDRNRSVPGKSDPEKKLDRFLSGYKLAACIIAVAIAIIFFIAVFNMPEFGSSSAPTNNEVVERYVGSAHEETGAANVIAGMILNYRGFDTFGESCVLFIAACCVMMLLWKDKINHTASDDIELNLEDEGNKHDAILHVGARIIIPVILCFGICVLFNGHISPGGGFSGGSLLGASLILFSVSLGAAKTRTFLSSRVYNVIRISGLCIYGVLFFIYILLGANGIANPLAQFIVLIVDIAVGLVVMSTMYGFYAFYTRGEL